MTAPVSDMMDVASGMFAATQELSSVPDLWLEGMLWGATTEGQVLVLI